MLERLEAERRRASSAALAAQEEERARVARDLHDEVNQSLTGLLLRLEAAREQAPPELAAELAETRALANQAMEELLALARQLRPTALDDLGLRPPSPATSSELERQGGIETELRVPTATSRRPARATSSSSSTGSPRRRSRTLSATRMPSTSRRAARATATGSSSTVADDGRGFTFDEASRGLGIAGMRERALLVGGDLQIESRPEVGTRVRLAVPMSGG